ncbi:ABC transporter permease [Microvirga roseola]|uniref:ABC transporter permease n=1 Tax=Microvirga roseola TaxID=2883126 RepID=UPI001E62E06D|nr:ABC transporter permease [Microvirga roseola]
MRIRRAYDGALALALAVSVVLFIVPQLFFVRQSFFESLAMGMMGDQLSFANYATILSDGFYIAVFVRTIVLSAIAALVALFIAYPTAYWLARLNSPVLRWLIILLLVSSFVSIVVKVLGLSMLLGSQGPFATFLRFVTLGWWSGSLLHNELAVAIGLVQYSLPLLIMLLFGVVQTIPKSLEDAALVHGASDWSLLRRILLPLSLNGIVTAGLIAFNMNMGAFTSAVLLGGGNVLTVPVVIQRKIVLEVDYPVASALSVLLTTAVIVINLLLVALRRGGPVGAGQGRQAA